MSSLNTSIEYLKGVGPKVAELLRKELNIYTYQDLLDLIPYRYEDKSKYYTVQEALDITAAIQLVGKITALQEIEQKKGRRLVARFSDDTGEVQLVWFKAVRWFKKNIPINQTIVVYGKPTVYNNQLSISHPEIEILEKHKNHASSLHPVYSSTEKLNRNHLNNNYIRKIIRNLFEQFHEIPFPEKIPSYLQDKYKLLPIKEAYLNLHFPSMLNKLQQAEYTLKFEELWYLQLRFLLKKSMRKRQYTGYSFHDVGMRFNQFYHEILPFELTDAQKKVLRELRHDLGQSVQMNRLLQGDVGSGKTVIAFMCALIAADNGFQTIIMAPTEILAQQHYNSLQRWSHELNMDIAFLAGSTTSKNRKIIHEGLLEGNINILIGTHAVIEDIVQFKSLGLVIIDEQHRFGVAQRAKTWEKNTHPPHVLVMTATPIPRTLAMSLYGDLDLSVIDELPQGRKPVKTIHQSDENRLQVFHFLKKEITKGRQVYCVYPLIQESEKLDLKDLMDGYESISRSFPLPTYKISIVHGKMKAVDKQYEMDRFAKGDTQIMVSTTVIEVGVNIPNASVMVIENAERFGLAQLHQLRGRVGRGADQSYCIMMTSHELSENAKLRIQTMCNTNDGFKIAEADLKLRGPGNIMGTQQSGALALKIASIVKDEQLVIFTRQIAVELLKRDPNLEEIDHQLIKKNITKKDEISWGNIS